MKAKSHQPHMPFRTLVLKGPVRQRCGSLFATRTRKMRTGNGVKTRGLYINLPVRDLQSSLEFFRQLGFKFDRRFTDDRSACMIVNNHAHVVLLSEPFFQTFTKRELCDRQSHTESVVACSCGSRTEVEELTKKAIDAGGKRVMDPVDLGFMYGASFYDLDGHHWEMVWLDNRRRRVSGLSGLRMVLRWATIYFPFL
jgi:predicted lactoylglutathione lyase